MEFHSYTLTITTFSKILYKKSSQRTMERHSKNKVHSKMGVWWGNGKL